MGIVTSIRPDSTNAAAGPRLVRDPQHTKSSASAAFRTPDVASPPVDAAAPLDAKTIRGVLRSRALALGADTHQAEDLAQQALANVLAKAPEKATHAGYAIQTLTRLWLDHQRSLRARTARLKRAALSTLAGKPLLEAHDDTRAAIIRAAIDRLPPKQRAALVLRIVEGLGYSAIAEALGCTEEAARASLHEARARMKRELIQRGIEP